MCLIIKRFSLFIEWHCVAAVMMGRYSKLLSFQPLLHVSVRLKWNKIRNFFFFAIFIKGTRKHFEGFPSLSDAFFYCFLFFFSLFLLRSHRLVLWKKQKGKRKSFWKQEGIITQKGNSQAHNSQSHKNSQNGSPYLSHKYLLRDKRERQSEISCQLLWDLPFTHSFTIRVE